MIRKPGFRYIVPVVILVLFLLSAAVRSGTAAPDDTPQRLTFELVDHWTMDDTFLYWSSRSDECDVFIPLGAVPSATDAAATLSFLHRRPINGGMTLQLGSANYCTYGQMAAGEPGVYFEDNPAQQQDTSRVVYHPRNDPTTAIPAAENLETGVQRPLLRDGFIYWAQGFRLYRAPQTGGSAEIVSQLAGAVNDFTFVGNQIVAATTAGIYFVNPNCGALPCAGDSVAGTVASRVLDGGPGAFAGVFHVVQSASQQLQKLNCLPDGNDWQCQVNVIHDSPAGWHISGLTGVCIPKLGGICTGYTSYFVAEVKDDLTTSRLLRGSGAVALQEIAAGVNFANDIHIHEGYVYWAERTGDWGIYRLPFNAAPLARDLEAAGWEVTQAIQNLDNEVPLVAGKETYVIVHGRQLSGPVALTVEATLTGTRNGTPLPGSPLRPIAPTARLQAGAAVNRADDEGSWIFKLPTEWTSSGSISLRTTVDPRNAYADPAPANNVLQAAFTFSQEPDACLLLSPVRTHAPLPAPTDPNFWPTIHRFSSLWPTDRTQLVWMGELLEELETCWWGPVPYPCFGPYEMDQGWDVDNFPPDKDRVIMKLISRHALSAVALAEGCDIGLFDPSFAVGLVHPDSDTTVVDGDKSFTFGGYAWPLFHASWIKLPDHSPPAANPNFDWPHAGGTLAHEVSHNLLRRHVDCPKGGPDGPDDDYPYNDCLLDDGAPADPDTYFGYDPISRQPVPPTAAADIMSYAANRWMSDYTYRAVRNNTFAYTLQRQAARNELAAADEIVYISGFYDPGHDVGELNYAYELAAENLDTARLAEMLAPSVLSAGPGTLAPTAAISGTLKLLAPGGALLDEKLVELIPNDDYGEETGYFTAVFPALSQPVGTVQLLVGGEVVAARSPGVNPPKVTILEPMAGANLDQTIRIRWRATDPDEEVADLLHTIHYSPDNGQSWYTLVTDYADQTNTAEVTLELQTPEMLPGTSTQSLVKVATSDGYHTTEVTSAPFTVTNRPPVAGISLPLPGTVFDPGTTMTVRGGGYDPEEGSLAGSALQWSLDGQPVGAGTAVSLAGLAPGSYDLSLQATSTISLTNRSADHAISTAVDTTLTIAPLSVPLASSTPGLNGRCDDSAYVDAAVVGLKPWPQEFGASQSAVQLVRTATDMWACFAGLGRLDQAGLARLLVDGNFDHTGPIQGLDVGFQVNEGGTPQRLSGAAGNWQIEANLAGFDARVTAAETTWQAEMRIPLALINTKDGAVGLYLSHNVEGPGVSPWPYDAGHLTPSSWAQTILGDLPRLDAVDPPSAAAGANKLTLSLTGRRFANDAVVYWGDTALPTTVISVTELEATAGAALLDTAGEYAITVVNPGSPDFTSEARQVLVLNGVPVLTGLSPEAADVGSEGFTLTVQGTGFKPGAIVFWNGEARQTAFVSAAQLTATIRKADLALATTVGVTVANPQPHAGLSAALPFVINPSDEALVWRLYLPATAAGQ